MISDDLRILLVDDSPQMLQAVGDMLNEMGYESIMTAIDGDLALNRVDHNNRNFDLVICDQNMSQMSGLDFLKELRKIYSKEDLPFIMLTSQGTRENIVKMMQNGGNEFLVKPTSKDEIKRKIDKVFK